MSSLLQIFHVSFPGLGINDLEISRVAFELKLFGRNFPVYWYGIGYAVAFSLCLLLALRQCQKAGLEKDDILDSYIALMILGIVGGRLYYVLFSLDNYRGNWSAIFSFRDGGMGFYGGVIGGILAICLVAKRKKINLAKLIDFFAVYLPLGQAIGRWGNFFNQEAFGCNTTAPWGMISEGTAAYLKQLGPPHDPTQPVHPTFFYEFLGNMLIFALLLYLRKRGKSDKPYLILATYLLSYGLLRFYVEGLRTDSLYIANTGIRVSQALSLLMVLVSAVYLLVILRKQKDEQIRKES
ncbi:MAG: prolipoprotein diacylglyceryl transferase [Eubacteriales bacterium]|nr:prolipoprotein diacylglyceryl transferase [Eubacteriales bacterium]